ncbi:MAG: GNAT family N-acetyltransferase [Acidobacteria bacterium]|nr:GNAT family N-acetyltransferase [Acidobacteriota bacterium]
MDHYSTRSATGFDEHFLWERLYEAIYVPPNTSPPPKEILRYPGVARYLEGWGRAGDLGFIAVEKQTKKPVGAAWIRLWTESNHGYGFVDIETPELIVSVEKGHRGEGVGTLLLKRLIGEAGSRFRAVSLSVATQNRAMRLYERLGFEVASRDGETLTMVLRLGE